MPGPAYKPRFTAFNSDKQIREKRSSDRDLTFGLVMVNGSMLAHTSIVRNWRSCPNPKIILFEYSPIVINL